MNSFVTKLFGYEKDDESSGNEVYDKDALGLSYVGEAVHEVLRTSNNHHHHLSWNVTSGQVIGPVQQTPRGAWESTGEVAEGHDDWFPEKMGELIGRTEAWCDVMSLGPPDGKFLEAFQKGLRAVAERSKTAEEPVVVRMMFGNIAGMPVNCGSVLRRLTEGLPLDSKVQVWVGAWRRGFSWNHAKLIAVDGVFLQTGGHNLWDAHYLGINPVHDVSVELEGRVARDGHRFANEQWRFIQQSQLTCTGYLVDQLPDYLPVLIKTRVTVSEFPAGQVPLFPPQYKHSRVAYTSHYPKFLSRENRVPMISIGRQGTLVLRKRPSDDAILAMLDSSRKVMRLVLQDLGPVCIPGTKKALPGLTWPKPYLAAMARAIYQRGVDVEIILSNPGSIPGGLSGAEANYGNGWDCVDVAAEIIKAALAQFPDIDDSKLRAMVTDNLRICFTRHAASSTYPDGTNIGMHSKHFFIDDLCCYIGSQNLYFCDLAEWGVLIDDQAQVQTILDDYFAPLWKASFTGQDVDVQKVMDGLDVDRDGEPKLFAGFQTAEDANKMVPHGNCSEHYHQEDCIKSPIHPPTGEKIKNN